MAQMLGLQQVAPGQRAQAEAAQLLTSEEKVRVLPSSTQRYDARQSVTLARAVRGMHTMTHIMRSFSQSFMSDTIASASVQVM